jgi:O-acetyl-ADP-ribose deacetylase (regulator of RNase III)
MKLSVVCGDITKLGVDVIVNAANNHLTPGGGVCGAIHAAAGPKLAAYCRNVGLVHTGKAVLTPAYGLRFASYVVHAVGPVWRGGDDDEPALLHDAYFNALDAAAEYGCRTIAFPCISTGIYGYPPDLACAQAIQAVRDWAAMRINPTIKEITFCCFTEADAERYRKELAK